ncbi:hypothetical protein [Streptomyces sp. NPDC021139]|uniref:hypothetical protein n=1 Tax=unclassified Streptomyces TaxID=2593676 RepID=UPI00340CA6BC
MTPVDGTATTPPEPGPDWLAWIVIATTLVSIAAVVVLALANHTEAAVAAGGIGAAFAGAQINVRSRR